MDLLESTNLTNSPQNLELGHFTLFFCGGRQRNVPRFKMHVRSDCFFVHCSFATLSLPSSLLAGFPDIFDAGIKIFEKL